MAEGEYALRRLRTVRLSIHRREPRWRGWVDRGPGFVGARWGWFYVGAEFDPRRLECGLDVERASSGVGHG